MKHLRLLTALLIAVLAFAGTAGVTDDTPPVRWRTIVRMSSPTQGTVTFKALIAEGWHLYGTEIPEGGPRATSFNLSGSTGLEFTGPVSPQRTPERVDDPMFGMTLTWWDANVSFTVPFRLTGQENPTVKAAISYMTCNGTTCRPPKTERINATVPPYSE